MTKWRTRTTTRLPVPTLRFSPTAWAKLLFLRDLGPTEIGAFGITAADDLLYLVDVVLVAQLTSALSVEFDDAAVADFFDAQVDAGRRPEQFARIWLHTHPGDCPRPSSTDEDTFDRVFGRVDWAVMFILAAGGQTHCRLRFNAGPGGTLGIAASVNWQRPFGPSDFDAWRLEYDSCVVPLPVLFHEELPPKRRTGAVPIEELWPADELWLSGTDLDADPHPQNHFAPQVPLDALDEPFFPNSER